MKSLLLIAIAGMLCAADSVLPPLVPGTLDWDWVGTPTATSS